MQILACQETGWEGMRGDLYILSSGHGRPKAES